MSAKTGKVQRSVIRIVQNHMVMGALLSILFSFIFIVWLDMGVLGAGLALLLAQIASVTYLVTFTGLVTAT